MTHQERIIEVTMNIGFPYGLPQIIAEYAKLNTDERFQQIFRFGNTVELTMISNDYHMCVQNTRSGIDISTNIIKDYHERMDPAYFIDAMNSSYIDLMIDDHDDVLDAYWPDIVYLKEKLINLWWSF